MLEKLKSAVNAGYEMVVSKAFGMPMSKKGMQIDDLYGVVLALVLVGVLLGVGAVILIKLMGASGVSGTVAERMINKTLIALNELPSTWLIIIVLVIAASIVIGLLVRSFKGSQ